MEKVFDSIFKTMVTKNPNLLIPLINEMFGTEYALTSRVTLLNDTHQTERIEDEEMETERVTDSYIRISGNNYHIESQSNPDGSIVLRMIEYDFHIALDEALRSGCNVMKFPRSAVLYLRHTSKTPDQVSLIVEFSTGERVKYEVPIIKAKRISKDEIMKKKLYFLVPYYIMRVEDEPLEQVMADLLELIKSMNQAYENGELTSYDVESVYNHIGRLVHTAYNSEQIRKGVEDVMGGQILYTHADELLDQGREEGREEGKDNLAELFRRLLADQRDEDVKRALEDEAYMDSLLEEYGLVFEKKNTDN